MGKLMQNTSSKESLGWTLKWTPSGMWKVTQEISAVQWFGNYQLTCITKFRIQQYLQTSQKRNEVFVKAIALVTIRTKFKICLSWPEQIARAGDPCLFGHGLDGYRTFFIHCLQDRDHNLISCFIFSFYFLSQVSFWQLKVITDFTAVSQQG